MKEECIGYEGGRCRLRGTVKVGSSKEDCEGRGSERKDRTVGMKEKRKDRVGWEGGL